MFLGVAALAASQVRCADPGMSSSTPMHDWATNPFAPPQSEAPEHVAEMYGGIDHEVLVASAKVRDTEQAAMRNAEAARKAAEDKSPEAFLRGVRSFKPGNYELLFRCAIATLLMHRLCSRVDAEGAVRSDCECLDVGTASWTSR